MIDMMKTAQNIRKRLTDSYSQAEQFADRHFPADERAKQVRHKWFAVCGYTGLFFILAKFLWSCTFLPELLTAFGIADDSLIPDWLSIGEVDQIHTLLIMALSVLILYIASPVGQHERPPRVLYFRLPCANRYIPVRLLMYAAEAAVLVLCTFGLFLITYDFMWCMWDAPWKEIFEDFADTIRYNLSYYAEFLMEKILTVFLIELVVREIQVFLYKRRTARMDAEEQAAPA